ncbi:LAMI_0F11540g1_1 [Lachancea mirantina]|uniref:LAMI_0F11540g1_1 n=1 Tax=Lachancea mirantina TaxID=1230905 RepID=A0A1G4K2H1_9SACH|nr:LAMI_0F11540g1_1 [Lachancea mirantina]
MPQALQNRRPVKTFSDMLYHHSRALSHVSVAYASKEDEIESLLNDLHQVLKTGKKLVFAGCGKSLKIIYKTVAMLTSLGMDAAYLHPSEALHGDMGAIRRGDAIIVCSSSGETQELVSFMKYTSSVLQPSLRVLVSSRASSTLQALADRTLLIPQPAEFQESYLQDGLQSPTVSTTLMLAVLDCLCLALSELHYEGDLERRRRFFQQMHPGGGIGKSRVALVAAAQQPEDEIVIAPRVPVVDLQDAVTEPEFLRCVVEFDCCRIAGVDYNSNFLQQRYRLWKQQAKQYPSAYDEWGLRILLDPRLSPYPNRF